MKKMFTRSALLLLAISIQHLVFAQAPPTAASSIADTLKTVEVAPDNRVTFRFFAPKASTVTVGGDFRMGEPPAALTKGEDGVWSYTSDPIPPDSYTYNFSMDGVGVLDTRAANFKDNPNSLFNWFDMPGPETDFMALKDVPHGRVERVLYHSSTVGMERSMHVYLPPNFEKIKGKLPVLYLLHGAGDNDISWTSAAKVPLILDNLYAEGKVKNMIVVMPSGHVPNAPRRMMAFATGADADAFTKDFLTDLKPYVEKTYPVSTKREDTAIAGFSMGGVQTLNLALGNPLMFDSVIAMSTGYFPNAIEDIEKQHGDVLTFAAQYPFKLFLIGRGKDDKLVPANSDATMKLLDKYSIHYQYQELNGAHSFVFSRRYLAAAFPQLFR